MYEHLYYKLRRLTCDFLLLMNEMLANKMLTGERRFEYVTPITFVDIGQTVLSEVIKCPHDYILENFNLSTWNYNGHIYFFNVNKLFIELFIQEHYSVEDKKWAAILRASENVHNKTENEELTEARTHKRRLKKLLIRTYMELGLVCGPLDDISKYYNLLLLSNNCINILHHRVHHDENDYPCK